MFVLFCYKILCFFVLFFLQKLVFLVDLDILFNFVNLMHLYFLSFTRSKKIFISTVEFDIFFISNFINAIHLNLPFTFAKIKKTKFCFDSYWNSILIHQTKLAKLTNLLLSQQQHTLQFFQDNLVLCWRRCCGCCADYEDKHSAWAVVGSTKFPGVGPAHPKPPTSARGISLGSPYYRRS